MQSYILKPGLWDKTKAAKFRYYVSALSFLLIRKTIKRSIYNLELIPPLKYKNTAVLLRNNEVCVIVLELSLDQFIIYT